MWVIGLVIASVFAISQSKTVVKPGDNVAVVCEEEPSLSKDYAITRDGYIVMQFVGAVNIAGLNEATASAKIAATLIEQRILQKATVHIKIVGAKTALIAYGGAVTRSGEVYPRPGLRLSDVVAVAQPTSAANLDRVRITTAEGKELGVNYRAFDGKDPSNNPELRAGDRVFFDLVNRPVDVSVTGQVSRPGSVPFTNGMTARGAISAAGGLGVGADDTVKIEHAGTVKEVNIKTGDSPLQPGDRLFVPQKLNLTYVNVGGAVVTPRRVPFRDGLTLSQAIEGAGGPLPNADLKNVKVTRKIEGKDKVLNHNVVSVHSGLGGDLPLQANDIVELTTPKRRGNRGGSTAVKAVGAIIVGALFGILRF